MKKLLYFTAVTHFFFALPQYYRLLHCLKELIYNGNLQI